MKLDFLFFVNNWIKVLSTLLQLARSPLSKQLFFACNIFIVEILARPNHEQVQQANVEKLDVQDTDDEFIIKKPSKVDPKYKDFLDELYRKDNVKNADKKTKREAEAVKAPVEDAKEYVIPEKPQSGVNENYDKFISELYSHDAEKQVNQQPTKLHRQKRMLIFRREDWDILRHTKKHSSNMII